MITSTKSTRKCYLEKPSDWHDWIYLVEMKAKKEDLWGTVDPDLPVPTPLIPPRRPLPQDFHSEQVEGATTSVLTDREYEDYKMAWTEFMNAERKIERRKAALHELTEYILGSIHRDMIKFVQGESEPHKILATLKTHFKPTDEARYEEVRKSNERLRETTPRPQGVEKWLYEWEQVYREAEIVNLPDISDGRGVRDLLYAIEPLHRDWAVTKRLFMKNDTTSNSTFYEVIKDFRSAVPHLSHVRR